MTVVKEMKLIIYTFVCFVMFLLMSCANPRLPGTKFLDINELQNRYPKLPRAWDGNRTHQNFLYINELDIQQGNVINQDMFLDS